MLTQRRGRGEEHSAPVVCLFSMTPPALSRLLVGCASLSTSAYAMAHATPPLSSSPSSIVSMDGGSGGLVSAPNSGSYFLLDAALTISRRGGGAPPAGPPRRALTRCRAVRLRVALALIDADITEDILSFFGFRFLGRDTCSRAKSRVPTPDRRGSDGWVRRTPGACREQQCVRRACRERISWAWSRTAGVACEISFVVALVTWRGRVVYRYTTSHFAHTILVPATSAVTGEAAGSRASYVIAHFAARARSVKRLSDARLL